MAFSNVIIVILLAAVSLLLFLYFFEFFKNKKHTTFIKSELKIISEKMSKIAFGYLNQHLDFDYNDEFKLSNTQKSIDEVKKNFNDITSEPILRLCYVGTDAWFEGGYCATIIGEHLKGNGKVAILVTSNLKALIMSQRQKSFSTTINDKYPDITIVETFESMADQEKATEFVSRISLEVDAIYTTGNSTAIGAAKGLELAGRVGKVYLMCHDLDASISSYIAKGVISSSLVCSTIAQGRDPTLHLFNHIVYGWKPKQPRLYVPLELVDKNNLNQFWSFNDNTLVEIKNRDKGDIKPSAKSSSLIRIIALVEDWNTAFKQMKIGIEIAAEILKHFNAEIVIYTVNQLKSPPNEIIEKTTQIIEQESLKGLHGIVTFVGSQAIVPLLNKQFNKGIPIATFNSEPLGLRSMILWLSQSSLELEKFSNEYTSGHQEINIAVQQVLSTLNKMVEQINLEAESVKEGADSVNELKVLIDKTVIEDEHQMEVISSSSKISGKLVDIAQFFNSKIEGLKIVNENIILSGNKIDILKNLSNKMLSIISIIDDITKQTNLLSINASIEATKTGQTGKGFSIIAKEIRALSNKSELSTKDVTTIITEMLSSIEESATVIESTKTIVNEQVTSIFQAINNLNEISNQLADSMDNIQKAVVENTKKILIMKDKGQSLNKVIINSEDISTENSKSIESLSSMFSEISMQFNEMNSKTKELNDIINILYNTASQFNTQ